MRQVIRSPDKSPPTPGQPPTDRVPTSTPTRTIVECGDSNMRSWPGRLQFISGTDLFLWAAWLCLLLTALQEVHAADDNWRFGGSLNYSNGSYGAGTLTGITYLPFTIRRLFDKGDLSVIVPYISITGNCGVTLIGGVPNNTGGTCPSRTITTRTGREVTRTLLTRTTESGLGDILLRGRYYVLDGSNVVPTVALMGRVKLPTADSAEGLGTGRFDETVGFQLTQRLPADFVAFADGGYTFIGHVPGAGFRNQWYYDLGFGYYFTKTVLASVYYEEWRSVIAGFQNPQNLLVGLNWRTSQAVRLSSALLVGLSDGAPDYGFTLGANTQF